MGQYLWVMLTYFLPIWLLCFFILISTLAFEFRKDKDKDYFFITSPEGPAHYLRAFIIITSFSYWFIDITTFSKTVELMLETGMKFTAMYALVKYMTEASSK